MTSFSHAHSGPWAQMVLFSLGQIRFLKSPLKANPLRGPGGGDCNGACTCPTGRLPRTGEPKVGDPPGNSMGDNCCEAAHNGDCGAGHKGCVGENWVSCWDSVCGKQTKRR